MTQRPNTIENRSEIVFLYDAVDANPNGNPLSGANRPRIDADTDQAIVTDVRLKRYLRDQLEDDGHGVYIRNVKEGGYSATREDLLRDRLKDIEFDDVEGEEMADRVYGKFLTESVDVRYFGATMSVDTDDERIDDHLPDHFTGPVQFSPGKTLHAVNENEEYNSLTSVIATQEQKEQGGFDLDDHRIQYGLIGFHGLIDEHGASDTWLTPADVRRLDTLCWRAIKNQTISRSKVGQEPRLYMRVEYDDDSFHLGGLTHDLEIDWENSEKESELRNIRDISLDITRVVDRIDESDSQINQVHVVASDSLAVTYDGTTGGQELLYDSLRDAVSSGEVHVINIYEEHKNTLPAEAD